MKENFEYKVYDKFTELFVGQKGITESLKTFEGTVENLAISISKFHLRVDDMEKVLLKQSALISASVKVAYIVFVSLGIGSAIMCKEIFHEFSGAILKFFGS